MRLIALFTICFTLAACQNIRMKYESVVESDGSRQKYTYANSYPVGGSYSSLCYITGIFLGGTCWFYLVMPTVQQKTWIMEDANDYLSKKLAGQKYEESSVRISKVSYSEGGEEALLQPKERPNSDNPPAP